MDTFIDKLAQKLSSQEMIKANMAAEAKENKRLKEKIEQYEEILKELRQVNLKNIESAERVNQLVQSSGESIKQMASESGETIKQMANESGETIKQAAEELKVSPAADTKQMEALFEKADDSMHKENVKVYRNVQAAINEGLDTQTEKILAGQKEGSKKQSVFFKVMSILIFVAVLADIVLQLLDKFGIF